MLKKKKSRSSYRKNIGRRSRINHIKKMNGGLGQNDSVNIGLQGKYVFTNEAHKHDFAMFTFGSNAQYDAWLGLLTVCKRKSVPFYILTKGDKIGIIRTLQLLGIDDMVHEVLCTRNPLPPHIALKKTYYNPENTVEHNFHGQDKYVVIEQIMREYPDLNCAASSKIGYLIDDSESNLDYSDRCPSIVFEHVLSHKQLPSDIDFATLCTNLESNPIYNLNVERLKLEAIKSRASRYNFTPIDILKRITEEVNSGTVSILFVDFDQTFQIFEGATQFGCPNIREMFNELNINIAVIE
jgi:hypothetical protein